MHIRTKIVSAAVGVALAWGAAEQSKAATFVIGGFAGACYQAAKAGRSNPDSIDLCTWALSREPLNAHDRAGTLVNRGAMYLNNRDLDQAHADFDKAMAIEPGLGEAHVGEGVWLINQERFAEAESQIDIGLAGGIEEQEKAYYFRGLARWGQDDFKGAYLDFQKALELKPGWDLPRRQLAHFQVSPAS